jgi:hypothetical protein
VLVLLALPPFVLALGQPFYVDLARRIMILAIAAVSLNLILGYGGLVSFGHAAYIGIGAYAVGILGFYGIFNGWLHIAGRDRRLGARRARHRRGLDPHQRHLLHHDHARLHADALLPRHFGGRVRR